MIACAKPLWCFPNMEMGDNIVCNGMCRFLAARNAHVNWVAKRSYVDEIRIMFSDLKNVSVVDGYDYPEARRDLFPKADTSVRMGFFGPEGVNWQTVAWDREFYAQAKVDFDNRWSSFRLPTSLIPQCPQSNFVLIHDIPERRYVIREGSLPKIPQLRITRRASFWDWMPEIFAAAELHFVDSSYLNLAESLYAMGHLRNTRLVFHSYAKRNIHSFAVPPILRAPWTVL